MKANELRIGNYIYGYYETEPEEENEESQEIDVLCKFIGYDPFEKYIWVEAVDGMDYEFSNFNPIPLTEEWLAKFGFDINSFGFAIKNNIQIGHVTKDENYQFEYSVGMIGKWILIDIKHVHQLQNLYFALTGEELHENK